MEGSMGTFWAKMYPYCPPWGQKRTHIAIPGDKNVPKLPSLSHFSKPETENPPSWMIFLGQGHL